MTVRISKFPLTGHIPPVVSPQLEQDSALDRVLDKYIKSPFDYLTCDENAIAERNDIIRALLKNRELYENLCTLKRCLDELSYLRTMADDDPMLVISSINIFPELCTAITELVNSIDNLVHDREIFTDFRNSIDHIQKTYFLDGFSEKISEYITDLPSSVSYCAMFDDSARLSHIALANVGCEPYRKSLFSQTEGHEIIDNGTSLLENGETGVAKRNVSLPERYRVFLEKLLSIHIGDGKRQITMLARSLLSEFEPAYSEFGFYMGAVELALQWENYGCCFAEIMPADERVFDAHGMFHPLYGGYPTRNNLKLSKDASTALLGGINRGGKTTFLRTALSIQILFQMGYLVPAKSARLSAAESIMCVFARDEDTSFGAGKLGSELSQLQSAMTALNEHSFFAFNEPLTATSPTECCILSREILCAVKTRGCRGIWVTHIHELHSDTDEINKALPGGDIFSLRTAVKEDKMDEFSIVSGIPSGGSGAQEVFDRLKSVVK